MLTIAALNTRRIQIGHGVTQPFTYHPSVTANATSTVNELSGGRTFLGIGAGGNALRSMGMKPRTLREFREAVEFIKEYTAGNDAEIWGATMHSEWVKNPLRVYMAAAGPKSLQMAGEIADGVVFTSNADPVVAKWRIEQVQKGAMKVNRDPSKIDIWARGMMYIADDQEEAMREVAGYAVNSARGICELLSQKGPEIEDLRKRLEKERPGLIDDCTRVVEVFSEDQHEKLDTLSSSRVTHKIIETQHLAGKPEDICQKLRVLAEIGATTFATVTYTIEDKKGMLEEISDKIMPHFRN
jgi:5,10-methylenetetrahydromethanopterin reductase